MSCLTAGLLVLTLTGVYGCVLGRTLTGTVNLSAAPLRHSSADRVRLRGLTAPNANRPQNFKVRYVTRDGKIFEDRKLCTGSCIEVMGSPRSNWNAVYQAAWIISTMLRHAPAHIFDNLANHPNAGAGVFTSEEKLIVYPEFQDLADTPDCKGTCAGACSRTCSFDGRKFETLPGAARTRAVVSEDNILCTENDPYYRTNNILVHEFAHTLKTIALNASENAQVTRAYNNAKRKRLWGMDSYAMSDEDEYFAEGTGAFFLVNLQSTKGAGGMAQCPSKECGTETEVRSFIKSHDPQLYKLLSLVYFNGKPVSSNRLTICPV